MQMNKIKLALSLATGLVMALPLVASAAIQDADNKAEIGGQVTKQGYSKVAEVNKESVKKLINQKGKHSMSSIHTEITAINTAYDTAFNHKDAAAIAKLYVADAHVMPAPAGEVVSGRAEIEAFMAGLIKAGVIDHKLTMIEVVEEGDIAYQRGKWAGAMVDEKGVRQTFGGNVQVVYRKQADGKWLAVTHIWN